jgi:hypothetical protein
MTKSDFSCIRIDGISLNFGKVEVVGRATATWTQPWYHRAILAIPVRARIPRCQAGMRQAVAYAISGQLAGGVDGLGRVHIPAGISPEPTFSVSGSFREKVAFL